VSIPRTLRLQAHLQMLPILESGEEPTLVGGQAVMEGVMMRAPHSYCVAVRKSSGELITEEQPIPRMSEKYPIFKYPVLRGLGTLGQAMQLGFKSLMFSANAMLDESKEGESKPKQEMSSWMMIGNVVFSVGFFILLYKFVPLLLAERMAEGRFAINMVDGVLRLAIFLTFMFALSRMKDIRRVFEYHGAEHKVVFNFESGQPVTVENAQKFVTFHPRCGTSFMLVMMVIAMIIYALVPIDGFWQKFAVRIAFLPVIVGVSYELIRFAARRQGTLMGLLAQPGLWLQRVTTKPPDDSQAAVAIHALQGAMALEEKQGGQLVIA
jgi:uncharacterized protein YqhQ